MEAGAPLTRSNHISSSLPNSPPTKRSFLFRLRRNPSFNGPSSNGIDNGVGIGSSPYPHPTHAASTSAIPMKSTTSQERVKKNQVGVPIMIGVNRSELFGPSTSVKHGFALEDEIEWQRVKTLPRVRLVPPEDEGEPILLYPPPHYNRPSTPPPILPHPFLSPPTSPPTSPPRRPGSPPQSPPRRPTSIYSHSPTWAGMADGFVLPPPKFTRTGAGWGGAPVSMGVILPKTRGEVNDDRRKRMSGVSMASWTDAASPPISPPAIAGTGRMRSLESQEEIAVNKKMRMAKSEDEDLHASNIVEAVPIIQLDAPSSTSAVAIGQMDESLQTEPIELDGSPEDTFGPVAVKQSDMPVPATAPVRASTMPCPALPVETEASQGLPATEASARQSKRRTRALSLSAAFFSSPSLRDLEVPPLSPAPSRLPAIRKQRSLKQFFFSSSTPPGAVIPPLPIPTAPIVAPEGRPRGSMEDKHTTREDKNKGKKILQRARSKPSLKIDVKAAKPSSSVSSTSPATPALSTGRTEIASAVLETPGSTTVTAAHAQAQPQARGLSKRFSLSNMSQAFKRKSSMSNLYASAGMSGASTTPSSSMIRASSATSGSGSPIPMVPALPEEYKRKKDIKGKGREGVIPLSPGKSKTPDTEVSNEIITLSGLPRRSDSLEGIQTLSVVETDDGSTALAQAPQLMDLAVDDTLKLQSPPQPLLPALDLVPVRSASPVSIGTTSSIEDEETLDEQELVHAKLMHISPRTRRDPSVSLQEFLASAPGRAAGNVVIVPNKGVRRSVEAIVIGSAGTGFTPTNTLASTPRARKSVVLGLSLDRVMERRGSETEEEDDVLATPMDEMAELFPEGSDHATDMGNLQADETTSSKAPGAISSDSMSSNPDWVEVISPHDDAEGDERSSVVSPDEKHDLQSLPSDMVIMDTPPPPPPSQASPFLSPSPLIMEKTSTPKNRFASPEALFKRLSSSKRPSNQSTPHPKSSRDKTAGKVMQSQNAKESGNTMVKENKYKDIPLPSMPLDGQLDEAHASLQKDLQLRSLHFDTLGLDFGGWGDEVRVAA